MALLQSITTSRNGHAHAAGVFSTQAAANHHALNTSLKIAGVILLVCLCVLIAMTAQASGKHAEDEFNAANAAAHIQTSQTSRADTTNSQQSAGASASVQSTVTSDGNSVHVQVNGEDIDVPENGNFSKTVTNDDGTTTVTVTNTSDGGTNSSTSTSLNISSSSQSVGSELSNTNQTAN